MLPRDDGPSVYRSQHLSFLLMRWLIDADAAVSRALSDLTRPHGALRALSGPAYFMEGLER
jgi:hypothetical protein